ncbi:hypothetical protein BGZ61DRAFT_82180 [Ilyonectria robusta]|uniref:uncharacterized protein n=1 Tax=Ilyonectria robusta TaxID=1079257 RepID=UPI001E8D6CB5|nr:uncharacterized protein BGZ61DRAFT_82180 [Ilyonectria robusta]KAH8735616.1 hypothetical protein BGZ61DRAFT_82180 [Ilyonectria robusta]
MSLPEPTPGAQVGTAPVLLQSTRPCRSSPSITLPPPSPITHSSCSPRSFRPLFFLSFCSQLLVLGLRLSSLILCLILLLFSASHRARLPTRAPLVLQVAFNLFVTDHDEFCENTNCPTASPTRPRIVPAIRISLLNDRHLPLGTLLSPVDPPLILCP